MTETSARISSDIWDKTGVGPAEEIALDESVRRGGAGFIRPKIVKRGSAFYFDDIAESNSSLPTNVHVKPPIAVGHDNAEEVQGFICLKKYDGVILSRGHNSFWARLQEDYGMLPVIEAEFDLAELPEADRVIATEGAPIVWTVGYETQGGTRKRQSILYVRRIAAATECELVRSVGEIHELASAIRWE